MTLIDILTSPDTIVSFAYTVIGVCIVAAIVEAIVESSLAWYTDSRLARWVVHRIEAVMWAMPFGRRKAPGRRAGPPIHRAARHGVAFV